MFGPVFTLELLRERSRGRGWRLAAWGYAALLAWQVLMCLHDVMTADRSRPDLASRYTLAIPSTFEQFVAQHFVVLILVTPAMTATALGEEKAKGTLADLFTTSLSSAEILGGKLLARSLRALEVVLPALPVLVVVGAYAGLAAPFFAALAVLTLPMLAGVSALGLLCAVVSKHASGAVLATYLALGGALAVVLIPIPVLNPMETLARLREQPDPVRAAALVGAAVLAWLAVAGGCFALAILRLRPDGLRQMHGAGPRRARVASLRPPVGDDPIRWKEYYIEGLSLLPLFRRVDRLWGMLAAGGVTIVATTAIAVQSIGSTSYLPHCDPWSFVLLGALFLFAATLVVTVRSAGAVTGERERDTWESLRLTSLDGRTFLDGKLRGIFDSVMPYFIACALPAVLVSLPCGLYCGLATLASIALAWPLMYYAAATSLLASSRVVSTWRGLLTALYWVYGVAVLICWGLSMFFGALVLPFFVIAAQSDSRLSGEDVIVAGGILSGTCYAATLAALGRSRLRAAEDHALSPPPPPRPLDAARAPRFAKR